MALAANQNNVVQFPEPEQPREVDQSRHVKHRSRFRQSESHHQEMRKLAFRDEDYYHNFDNDQWNSLEKKIITERGQPLITHNEIKRKVNFLLGMEQRGRTDPKAFPRKPDAHEDMAKVASDILVYIDDKTRLDKTFSGLSQNLIIHGIEAAEVIYEDEDNKTVKIPYEEFFFDPMSKEEDFSDANYMGYARWFDEEDAAALYPDGEQYIRMANNHDNYGDTYEDRPDTLWISGESNRKRVRIIVMYYKLGNKWHLTHFTGAGTLYDEVSPYNDEDGKPHCAIEAQSLYIDRENRRYGAIRDMIGPQMEVNHNRSKIWALANNRRTWGMEGAFVDVDDAKDELAKIDGHVEVTSPEGQNWGFVDNSVEIRHLAELMNNAQNAIANQGPNSGLRGRGTESQSGRAIVAQQDAGMTEENSVFDGHKDFKLRIYKANWARFKQFTSEEKVIRIVTPDSQDGEQFMTLNQPLRDPMGNPLINPRTGQPAVKNHLADMDVEIILDAVPDTVNMQIEQFETLASLASNGVPIPPTALIKASQLRDKDEILKEIQGGGGTPEQQAAAQQQQQLEQQVQMEQIKAQFAEMGAKISDIQAAAALKQMQALKVQAEIPKIRAETQETLVDARIKPTEAAHRMASADDTRKQPEPAQN